jgi:hypothetical protein
MIVEELGKIEKILSEAEAQGIRWHLEVDFLKDKEKDW